MSTIIYSHSMINNYWVHDLQLQMPAPPDKILKLLQFKQTFISDDKAWVTVNMLKLNDKTELMLVTSKRTMHLHNLHTSMTIGYAQLHFKECVKNFNFTIGCHLTMNEHVPTIARTCYFQLQRPMYL